MTKTTREARDASRVETRLAHAGRVAQDQFGFVNTPIYRGSTVLFESAAAFQTRSAPYTYGTHGTPTVRALEEAWSEIAGASLTVLAPSGLAACALALMTATKAGDHLLIVDSAYQPTRTFCDTTLARFGVEVEYYDPLLGAEIASLFRPNTSAVLVESPGSLTLEVQDVPAIAAVAHAHGACVILDNSWATPLYFPPHERGVDLSVDAGTKYLSGHSDLLLGLVSANAAWARRLRDQFDAISMCAGPEDCFLALRGMRTLSVRLKEQGAAALSLARWLEGRPEVERVIHPALPSHPGHALWRRDFTGASGLFSVVLKPYPKRAVAAFLDALRLFGLGYSWGGYESLVIAFDCAGARTATRWRPGGPALRFSIGLENVDDLRADLEHALAQLAAAGVEAS